MAVQRSRAPTPPVSGDDDAKAPFKRVVAVVVALENYRGGHLPSVPFAHADADAFGDVLRAMFVDLSDEELMIDTVKDADASLTGLREQLRYAIRSLAKDDLFIFYYAGHGFHGAGGNRLSAYDTSRTNVGETSLHMRDDLLEPLAQSGCRQALVFVDACAEQFRDVIVGSRDVISNLDPDEVKEFLDSGWYCGVFLSCSPGEKSYPSSALKHGIWTHFLLEALSGRAEGILTQDRWLTDYGLRDYLRREVPRFITRETSLRGSQTPQAILSGSNSFRIRHIPRAPAVPADEALAAIKIKNNGEFLEGTEVGPIKRLDGFRRGHTVPTELSDSAESWCHRLLAQRVTDEIQELYERARAVLQARRRDFQKGVDTLDVPAFRYSIDTGQNPDDPAEYIIRRRLELRQGWPAHRQAIDELFGDEFARLVVEFESMDDDFDELVDKLEDVREEQGGSVSDDDRTLRVSYERAGVTFTFDLDKKRLEISFGRSGTLELVDAAQKFRLGISQASSMLSLPTQQTVTPHLGQTRGNERTTKRQS